MEDIKKAVIDMMDGIYADIEDARQEVTEPNLREFLLLSTGSVSTMQDVSRSLRGIAQELHASTVAQKSPALLLLELVDNLKDLHEGIDEARADAKKHQHELIDERYPHLAPLDYLLKIEGCGEDGFSVAILVVPEDVG